jgi:hypothetical protein
MKISWNARNVRWIWIAISVLVFLVACWISTGWELPQPQGQTRTAVLSSTDGEDAKDLIARGWIQSNRVSPGDKVHFWITFVNASGHDVQGLQLLFLQTPGFKPVAPCWTSSKPQLPSCFEGTSSLPGFLKSGASVTLWADLQASSSPGRYGLSAVFSWKNPEGARARKALLLGPVDITYPLADSVFPILQKVYLAGKDFGLPLALAVLTFLFGAKEQKRKDERELAEQRRKEDLDFVERRHKEEQEAAEQKRREAQKQDDERRAQIQQTWSQLLQKHLNDAQRHYLPMAAKLMYLLSRIQRQPPETRECFYWLMAFMRRMKFTADNIGGVHLKSRLAEEIFVSAWVALRDAVENRLGKVERVQALDSMKYNESLADFETRFTGNSLFSALENKFGDWLSDQNDPFACQVCLIMVMLHVLEYEANRPFEYWYQEPPEFPKKDLRTAAQALKNLPAATGIQENLGEYFRKMTGEDL